MNVKDWTVGDRNVAVNDVISLADLKSWMRVRHTYDDSLIEGLRLSALEYAEDYCRIYLLRTTAEKTFANFSGTTICLEGVNIADVTIHDVAANLDLDYKVTQEPFGIKIILDESLSDNEILVTFTSGYSDFPKSLGLTLMIIANTLYTQREDSVARLPTFVSNKLNAYKMFSIK